MTRGGMLYVSIQDKKMLDNDMRIAAAVVYSTI